MLNDGLLEKKSDAKMKHIAGSNEEKDNKYHRELANIHDDDLPFNVANINISSIEKRARNLMKNKE